MSSVINSLKNTLGIGSRANKYRVIINGVGGGPSGEYIDVLAKSTSIPTRSIADIEVWNQGRLTVIAGDVSFDGTWSVTFLDAEDHFLRKKFIAWMEYIDSAIKHNREATDHSSYMSTAKLQQLSTIDNKPTASYNFEDIYPKSISDSTLDDSNSEMIEFTVEFNYSSWSVS